MVLHGVQRLQDTQKQIGDIAIVRKVRTKYLIQNAVA